MRKTDRQLQFREREVKRKGDPKPDKEGMWQVTLRGNSYFKELNNREWQVCRSDRCHCTLRK